MHWSIRLLLVVIVIVVLISILLPVHGRPRGYYDQLKCAQNLKAIGAALEQYANRHDGHFPDDLSALWDGTANVDPAWFACPSTKDSPAATRPASPADAARMLADGHHLSYVYVGNGLKSDASPEAVLLYEPPSNHAGDGINVLFGDGHVDFLADVRGAHEMTNLISSLRAGINPPLLGTTTPAPRNLGTTNRDSKAD